ncbi:uncharacterized protein BDZ99DRAFT_563461 [Mytilinidion resinicola]|uniref:Uncharacterized protein n=1 Tax=Mytilinidion resinicola TaxID=574789 RepID=A0A6A6YNJ8_9PEZI|nr:uncharacterized protein BDZ99DRAFT_563461 [Mytilinidion resinicola]KAF2810442.1 hypothetical protein BDZ99DRAFT_563461 [Mytilinidion resinicola]
MGHGRRWVGRKAGGYSQLSNGESMAPTLPAAQGSARADRAWRRSRRERGSPGIDARERCSSCKDGGATGNWDATETDSAALLARRDINVERRGQAALTDGQGSLMRTVMRALAILAAGAGDEALGSMRAREKRGRTRLESARPAGFGIVVAWSGRWESWQRAASQSRRASSRCDFGVAVTLRATVPFVPVVGRGLQLGLAGEFQLRPCGPIIRHESLQPLSGQGSSGDDDALGTPEGPWAKLGSGCKRLVGHARQLPPGSHLHLFHRSGHLHGLHVVRTTARRPRRPEGGQEAWEYILQPTVPLTARRPA